MERWLTVYAQYSMIFRATEISSRKFDEMVDL